MKALVIGAGGVGSAIANIASRRPFITQMVIADRNLSRAEAAITKVKDSRFSAAEVNAAELEDIRALIRKAKPDIVINAVDPRFVMPIFLACEIENTNYMDMAMSLSRPHPHYPNSETGVKLGDEQFARDWNWSERGIYAVVGMGIEPGMSDIFARYASDELFSRLDEVTIFDGSNLTVKAPTLLHRFQSGQQLKSASTHHWYGKTVAVGTPPNHLASLKYLIFLKESGLLSASTSSTRK